MVFGSQPLVKLNEIVSHHQQGVDTNELPIDRGACGEEQRHI